MVTKKTTENETQDYGLTDPGDKVSASLTFKKNLGNYQSIDFFAGVTVTRRETESHEDVWSRAWEIVENELDAQVAKADKIIAESK
jgi:ribosomal protein L19